MWEKCTVRNFHGKDLDHPTDPDSLGPFVQNVSKLFANVTLKLLS